MHSMINKLLTSVRVCSSLFTPEKPVVISRNKASKTWHETVDGSACKSCKICTIHPYRALQVLIIFTYNYTVLSIIALISFF